MVPVRTACQASRPARPRPMPGNTIRPRNMVADMGHASNDFKLPSRINKTRSAIERTPGS